MLLHREKSDYPTTVYIGLDKEKMSVKKDNFFLACYVVACVLGAQKNRLIETVLLSTHNIRFGQEIKKKMDF